MHRTGLVLNYKDIFQGNRYSILSQLLRGADPNGRLRDGTPFITQAVKSGFGGTATLLVEAGADLEATDTRGWTPIMWAMLGPLTQSNPVMAADLCWQLGRRGARLDLPFPNSADPVDQSGWLRLQAHKHPAMKGIFGSLYALDLSKGIPQSDLGKLYRKIPKSVLAKWRERPTHFFNRARAAAAAPQ